MKSTATLLQQAYFSLLSAIEGVAVYDVVPANESYPYIQINDRSMAEFSTKSSFGEEVVQSLSIVDRFTGSFGSRIQINDVLDQVQQTIRARPVPISLTRFNVLTSTIDSVIFFRERTETHTYLRYEVRFRHLIEELVLLVDNEGLILTDNGNLLYG